MKKEIDAAEAIRALAVSEGMTVDEVRAQMKLAMRAGLNNQDPAIQANWRKIPCKGNAPTPEEMIAYFAARINFEADAID